MDPHQLTHYVQVQCHQCQVKVDRYQIARSDPCWEEDTRQDLLQQFTVAHFRMLMHWDFFITAEVCS